MHSDPAPEQALCMAEKAMAVFERYRLDPVLSVRDVAEYVGVEERAVWRWIERGRLPSVKIGGARRIKRSTLLEMLAQETAADQKLALIDNRLDAIEASLSNLEDRLKELTGEKEIGQLSFPFMTTDNPPPPTT